MKLVDYVKNVMKPYVYERYMIYADQETKDYEKITRKAMAEYIIAYVKNNPLIIQEILSEEELRVLIRLAEGEQISIYDEACSSIVTTHLAISDLHNILIPEELLEVIQETVKQIDWEYVKEKDQKNELLLGILKGYGVLSEHNFKIIASLYGIDEIETPYLKRFYGEEMFNGLWHIYWIELYDDIDLILDLSYDYRPNLKVFDEDALRVIAHYGADIRNKKIKQAYEAIKKNPQLHAHEWIWKNFLKTCHTFVDKDNESVLRVYLERWLKDKEDVKTVLQAVPYIQCAILSGNTPKEYKKQLKDEKIIQELNEPIIQRAKLDEKDVHLYYKLYMSLLEYVNQKYHIVKNVRFYPSIMVDPNKQVEVRNYLFDHISIIDDFIQDNPYRFNRRELAAIHDFKKGIKGHFIVLKHEKEFTVFRSDDGDKIFYGVKGLYDNLNEITANMQLPFMTDAVLLPFAGRIIYDGILGSSRVKMSARTALNILKDYDKENVLTRFPVIQGKS